MAVANFIFPTYALVVGLGEGRRIMYVHVDGESCTFVRVKASWMAAIIQLSF